MAMQKNDGSPLLYTDDGNKIIGYKSPDNSDTFFTTSASAPLDMTAQVLAGAVAGANSGWIPKAPYPERLAYSLDSGSTTTTFSIDVSADGVNFLAQAFTGSYASSAIAEVTPPLSFSNVQARFYKINVLSGGPISFIRGV